MLFKSIIPITVIILLNGCASSPQNQANVCRTGHTMLDGTCVTQEVANYVSCVRSYGADLGEEKNKRVSAEIGFIGTSVSGAKDVSDKLNRKYSASDKVVMEVIKRCDVIAGIKSNTGMISNAKKSISTDSDKSSATASKNYSVARAKNFKFEIEKCITKNKSMTCEITVTNEDKDRNLIVYPSTRAYNMSGNEYKTSSVSLVDTSKFKVMLSGLPMRLKLSFDSVNVGDRIPKLEILASISKMKHHRFSAVLKDVAVFSE